MTTREKGDIAVRLGEARERFIAANPLSRDIHESATQWMPGGNTRSTLFYNPFPLAMAQGVGCRLSDADGHEYVDLLGEYTAGLYGHNNPIIREAIDAALDTGWNFGAQGLMDARLAQLLCDRFPSIDLVRFTNSGTEANLLALATATLVTDRSSVLVFDGAYHGGVLSFANGVMPLNVPHRWVVASYNDFDGTEELVAQHASDLAAILVEPMIGSGGCIPADPDFLAALRRSADETGAILIFDEVMTSRMSSGGMQQRLGLTPDMTTVGKYLGGGMSFGAFGGSEAIMSVFDPRRAGAVPHAGTFNNNVLSMAAGYAGLTRIFTPERAQELFERGEQLRSGLNALCRQRSAGMQWTGVGSLMTAHFQTETIRAPGDVRAEAALRELFHLAMLDRGFYLARRGMLALSLEIGPPEITSFVAAIEDFLDTEHSLLHG
jgi:glutamate-1-semialdehyde 2,1-aminomutase